MKPYYWNREGWGSSELPADVDTVIELANASIDCYIDANPEADDDQISAYSNKLWNDYCTGIAPRTVYIAYEDRPRGLIDELAVTFSLDDAKDALLNSLHSLTENEQLRSRRYIRVLRGFGDTPEAIQMSHLVGLGYLDDEALCELNDETELFE